MDKRKYNGGHSTKGVAGRKSKADEIKLIEQMDAVCIPDKIWRALYAKCIDGDATAIKTWLAYRFGQPKQTISQETTHKFPTIDMNEWK
jgi:hypothetical protein